MAASEVIQGLGVIGVFVTAAIYYKQLKRMGEQLRAQQNGATANSILILFQFLQEQEVREARQNVIRNLAAKPFADWDEGDRASAATVCSSYTTVAIVLQLALVPIEPIITHWGPSIMKCYAVVSPLIKEMQKPEHSGPTYWAAFDWLHSQAAGLKAHAGVSKVE